MANLNDGIRKKKMGSGNNKRPKRIKTKTNRNNFRRK